MSNVVPLRKAAAVPVTPPLAEIRPLSSARQRPAHPAGRPPRRPRNGHHPDCPYPGAPADHCGICRSMAIASEPTP